MRPLNAAVGSWFHQFAILLDTHSEDQIAFRSLESIQHEFLPRAFYGVLGGDRLAVTHKGHTHPSLPGRHNRIRLFVSVSPPGSFP